VGILYCLLIKCYVHRFCGHFPDKLRLAHCHIDFHLPLVSIFTKLILYNTCILLIFLYGSECWPVTKSDVTWCLPRGMYNGVCVSCWESNCTTSPPCAEWWCETENRATTSFGYCSSMASLPVYPHCVNARQIRCQADLNSFPLRELQETTGMPLYYVDEDYWAGPGIIEPLPELSNWCGSELMSTFGTRHSVVHARNEWNELVHITCASVYYCC